MGNWKNRPKFAVAGLLAMALPVLAILSGRPAVAGQTAPAIPARARHRAARPKAVAQTAPASEPVVQPVQPAQPPQPEMPKWPVNEKAQPAAITWDSQGLRIDAANSSLQQILNDVSMATGAKIEGFSTDQRVFGVYGPGQARDVLSQVLQGAGYNVIMIGDQGMGAPRRIVLSSRGGQKAPADTADGQPNPDADGDNGDAGMAEDEPEQVEEPQPPPQPAFRPGFGPGGQPRTPQQIQQEMLDRQQQIQNMQNQNQNQPQ